MFKYIYVYCIIVAWVYEKEKIILIAFWNFEIANFQDSRQL